MHDFEIGAIALNKSYFVSWNSLYTRRTGSLFLNQRKDSKDYFLKNILHLLTRNIDFTYGYQDTACLWCKTLVCVHLFISFENSQLRAGAMYFIYIWACDERCSRLTRVCILLFIFILLQLHETVVAFIQYTLMSSSSKNWQLWPPRGGLKTKILDEKWQKAASGKWDNVGCSTSAENST